MCPHSHLREVLDWKGIVGIAEVTHPHPADWTFAELDTPIPLHKIKVRHQLTMALGNRIVLPPSCKAACERKLRLGELPWHLIFQRLHSPLLTNRDGKSNPRVIHRAIILV